jgi:membrane protein insertase Oxa1/YidC/SpoIIIJ
MPILFGFMLYNTAAGLTLYWLVSTFVGLLEQKYIKHHIKKLEATGKFGAAAEPTPEKPGWPFQRKRKGKSK